MGNIKNKWKYGFYIQSRIEFHINDWNPQLSASDYNVKYFLNKSCKKDKLHYIYNTSYIKRLLKNQNINNLKDFIYKHDKVLYYNVTSWTMFLEWIEAYIEEKYDVAKQSFRYNPDGIIFLKNNWSHWKKLNICFIEDITQNNIPTLNWYIVYNNQNKIFKEFIKENLIGYWNQIFN